MHSLHHLLTHAPQFLPSSESAKVDMEYFLCELLGRGRSYLFTYPEKQLSEDQWQSLQAWLERRQQGEPVAYILKKQSFWNLSLQVSPSTLIPRADTECLVEAALNLASPEWQQSMPAPLKVLDLGSGTGAIALALASEQPHWQVLGVDRIPEAVSLAQSNAKANGIDNARFIESNWCEQVPKGFAMVVSNPPYIDPVDPHLSQGDVRFEPRSALVADNHGMADIEHICQQAANVLVAKGWLLFEHGYDQGKAVRDTLTQAGYVGAITLKDYGDNDRVTYAQWLGKTP